ncbi:hypothetical protein RHMOL_Rhmol07G0243300 [Rhododendron molle]|uniref:Uncharacterized protein n=1 Tax=Rhododendron molle TaxID=49168 RepID=A0ACC0N5G7_RHOML|nr:hypothetical protein RHMOL_Rhmol07G0243300 [Rhododendron molle]
MPLKHTKRLEVVNIYRSPPTKFEPQMVELPPIWKCIVVLFGASPKKDGRADVI